MMDSILMIGALGCFLLGAVKLVDKIDMIALGLFLFVMTFVV
jgi:hypothetical protein